MRKISWLCCGLLMLVVAGCGGVHNPEAEAAAVDAARQWLGLVDSAQYAQSWEQSAAIFKGAVTQEQWARMMEGGRAPLGKNISRELKSKRYCTTLPGAPDGAYVVIQFKSSFEKKKSAVETITPMLDQDGVWRVSGYYMK